MNLNLKRVASTALAVVMSLGLSVTAFAEQGAVVPNGTLTVTGDQLIGKEVTAVRMFTARAINNGNEENPDYAYDSYTLEEVWLNFFQSSEYFAVGDYTGASIEVDSLESVTADDALAYMQMLTGKDETSIADFAHEAQQWYRENTKSDADTEIKGKLDGLTTVAEAISVNPENEKETKGKATFTDLTAGYYLVFPEGGSTGNNIDEVEGNPARGTDAMLINVPTDKAGATWNIKSTFPTVDKKVDTDETDNDTHDDATDNGSAQVGDTVTFTLTSQVPDMSDYETFYFAFHDTLTKGLDLVMQGDTFNENDVNVYIYNKEAGEEADAAHKVGTDDFEASFNAGEKKLDVVFGNLKNVKVGPESTTEIEPGDTIVVIYKAKITEDAISGEGSIVGAAENEVQLEYSNNPSTEDKGTSTPDVTKTYTYDIDVKKWASDMTTETLAGAQFKLTTDKAGENVVKLIATNETTDDTDLHNAYRVAKLDEETFVESFTTDDDGVITISGLEAGTYYLHEVAAPNGYNKLKDPLEITIIVDPEKAAPYAGEETNKYADVSFENPLYVVDGKPNATNDATIKVENKKGIELPETGSIGTIGLTVAGVAIVLLGVFAPRKKKKGNQE